MRIYIPGKTFLLGEYAVLQGGSAIIACTKPYFELAVREGDGQHPFHFDSPAGLFIKEHSETFQSLDLSWFSPYTDGGFGGSTAEFLACFKLHHQLIDKTFSQEDLYQSYLKYAYHNEGIPPSGADLIAQTQKEGVVHFQSSKIPLKSFIWSFEDISVLLFKTPNKLATHQHLKALYQLPEFAVLSHLVAEGLKAIKQSDKCGWINTIKSYAKVLDELSLTTESTKKILMQLQQHPACLAAKGCGALGADVIVVTVNVAKEKEFIATCVSQFNLRFYAAIKSHECAAHP